MPTAVIKPTSWAANSGGVSNIGGIYTNNNNGVIYYWPTGNTGDLWADYNTDAVSVLPADAVITHWKLTYKTAITPVGHAVYPIFRRNPNVSRIIITDWEATSGFTTYTYPASGSGLDVSDYNARSDFSVIRVGANRATNPGAESWFYIDYFEVEVTYELPGIPNLLFMGELF